MKPKVWILLLLMAASTITAQAAGVKCYVETEGKPKIVFFENIKERATVVKQSLTYIFAPDGVTRQPVTAVHECVAIDKEFTSAYARELEKKTPR